MGSERWENEMLLLVSEIDNGDHDVSSIRARLVDCLYPEAAVEARSENLVLNDATATAGATDTKGKPHE